MPKFPAALAALVTTALVAALLVPTPGSATAAPSARTGAVTLSKLPAKSQAGRRVTLKGTVAGAKAGVKVTIQRKYPKQGWAAVATTTTRKSGAYTTKVPLTQGGRTSFRAVANGRRSPVRRLTVWAWLDVADQSYFAGSLIGNQTLVVKGKTYVDSFLGGSGSGSGLYINPEGQCTKGRATTGFRDLDRSKLNGSGNKQVFMTSSFTSGGPVASTAVQNETSENQVRQQAFPIKGKYQIILMSVTLDPASDTGVLPVLASPQIYCKVSELPSFDISGLASRPALARAVTAARSAGAVTLAALPKKGEAGKKVTLKGAVAKAGAGVPVMIQRKYPKGGWRTVDTTVTKKSGAFSQKVALQQGGRTSFRVRANGRTSKVRSLTVWEWLNMTEQPYYAGSTVMNLTVKIKGRSYPHSVLAGGSSGPTFFTNPRYLCTKGRATIGFQDKDRSKAKSTDKQVFETVRAATDGTAVGTLYERSTTKAGPRKVAFPVTGFYQSFDVHVDLDPSTPTSVLAVLATPQVYCKVAQLPAFDTGPLGARTAEYTVRNQH